MIDVTEDDIFHFPIKTLKLIGAPLGNNTLNEKIVFYVVCPLYMGVYILTILKFFFINDLIDLAETFEALTSVGQISIKFAALLICQKEFTSFFKLRKKFWNPHVFGREVEQDYKKMAAQWLLVLKGFIISGSATLFLLTIRPFIDGSLPQAAWTPNKYVYYYVLIVQQLAYAASCMFVMQFDGLFPLMCVDMWYQFQLVGLSLKALIDKLNVNPDDVTITEDIKKCVDHHLFCYEMVEKIIKIYPNVFVIQYLAVLITDCMQFLLITDPSTPVTMKAKGVAYLICLCFQLIFYCFPASTISAASLIPAEALYESEWYTNNVLKKRTTLILILMRSQKQINMKAAGMFNMDRIAYINVLRAAFSVFTIMRA